MGTAELPRMMVTWLGGQAHLLCSRKFTAGTINLGKSSQPIGPHGKTIIVVLLCGHVLIKLPSRHLCLCQYINTALIFVQTSYFLQLGVVVNVETHYISWSPENTWLSIIAKWDIRSRPSEGQGTSQKRVQRKCNRWQTEGVSSNLSSR